MKRPLYIFLATAALLSVASCTKELVQSADPALGGEPVEVTFDINLSQVLTKAGTTELDDGSGTFQLYVAAFSVSDGSLISTSKIGGEGFDPVATLEDGSAPGLTLTLARHASYKVVFFAQRTDAYTVAFGNNNVATFTYKSGLSANNAGLDAFWGTVDVIPSQAVYEVTLKRPFAQLNVLVPNGAVPSGQTTFSSSMKVQAPTTFDLFAGEATGEKSLIEFSAASISATYSSTHKWVGMNYVLVPSDGIVNLTYFQESGMSSAISPGLVPVKLNGRTNLVGNVYSQDISASFTVTINPEFGSNTESPLEADAPGAYFSGQTRSYFAGSDQYCIEYDGTKLDFILLNPAQNEQLVISGYDTATHAVGDAITVGVVWEFGGTEILNTSKSMTITKIEDSQVWLESADGQGVVIRTE